MFYVDFLFEIFGLAEFHEFVSVAGVAILAAEFAAAIGVDHPAEGHASAGAARYVFAGGELEVLGAALGFERGTFGGQAGDTDQGCHRAIFAFCSPKVKWELSARECTHKHGYKNEGSGAAGAGRR